MLLILTTPRGQARRSNSLRLNFYPGVNMDDEKTPDPKDSPDREVPTPRGCLALLAIGDRALASLIDKGLPHIETSNSYRFPKAAVLEWLIEQSKAPKERCRRS
jgi:hypothetical protein